MTINEAIRAIVTYETLPPQIDYTKPWEYKARKAQEHIDRQPFNIRAAINSQIRKQITEYYGENGAAQYDKLF